MEGLAQLGRNSILGAESGTQQSQNDARLSYKENRRVHQRWSPAETAGELAATRHRSGHAKLDTNGGHPTRGRHQPVAGQSVSAPLGRQDVRAGLPHGALR